LANAMLKNNANSILITESGKPIGIITDREVLKEIVEDHKDPAKIRTKDLNYTPLLTLEDGESMTDALKTLRNKKGSRIAVVKNGQLVGMLTGDLAESQAKMLQQKTLKK